MEKRLNEKVYRVKVKALKGLSESWYFITRPIAIFLDSDFLKERKNKKKDRITEEQAFKWISEDIIRYCIKYNREIECMVCKWASRDDWGNGASFSNFSTYIDRKKTEMAYYKYRMDIERQLRFVEYLKGVKSLEITEKVEEISGIYRIEDYRKTILMKLK